MDLSFSSPIPSIAGCNAGKYYCYYTTYIFTIVFCLLRSLLITIVLDDIYVVLSENSEIISHVNI